jgi:hypothetical protein
MICEASFVNRGNDYLLPSFSRRRHSVPFISFIFPAQHVLLEAGAFEVDLRHQLAAAATRLEPGEIPKHSYG